MTYEEAKARAVCWMADGSTVVHLDGGPLWCSTHAMRPCRHKVEIREGRREFARETAALLRVVG